MNGSGTLSGEDLVREVVAELAPREVPQLDLVLDAYRRDPWPVVPVRGGWGHPNGAGAWVDQAGSWAVFVTAFLGNVLAGQLAEEGFKRAGRGLRGWLRRPKSRLADPAPDPLDDRQLAEVGAAARQAALDRGFPDASAEQFAAAVTRALGSRRP